MSEAQPAAQAAMQSRLGKRPISVPAGVTVTLKASSCEVKGPKGQLGMQLPEKVAVTQEGGVLKITSSADPSDAPRLQGLARALLANLVNGVTTGYQRVLELQGTGYRAELKGRSVTLNLGLSHPVVVDLPPSVTANIPGDSKGTIIILESPDKALLGQVAATMRSYRPPEPYNGKGVRYRGEHVRRKAGKAGKK